MSISRIIKESEIPFVYFNSDSNSTLECREDCKFLKPLCLWIQEESFDHPLTLSLEELARPMESKNNPLSKKIAKHQIFDTLFRTHIDPLRSFVELVSNALDTKVGSHKRLGQHGIGFLLSLSFLFHEETEGCFFIVETTYEYKGCFFSYRIEIDKSRLVKFIKLKPQQKYGTTISIKPCRNSFSKETLENLCHHLSSLQFYEHGSILIDLDNQKLSLGKGNPLAKVILEKNFLQISDEGPGIPLEVAQTQLFVDKCTQPASSRSSQEELALPELVDFKGKKDVENSYFLISIGGCIINAIAFREKEKKDLLLKFPASVRLTLAKDAIEFKASGKRAEKYLKRVIDRTIEEVISGNSTSEHLLLLYRGLKQWKMEFSKYLERQVEEKILKNPELVAIPYEQVDFFREFALGRRPIPLHGELIGENFKILEQIFVDSWEPKSDLEKRALERKIIAKKRLFFVPDKFLPKRDGVALITDFGMASLLFVPLSLVDYAAKRSEKERQSVDKILAFSIAHRYCPEGIRIVPHFSLCATKSAPFSSDDEYIRIAASFPKTALFNFELQTCSALDNWDDSILSQFWDKHRALALRLLSFQNPAQKIVFYDSKQFLAALPKIVNQCRNQSAELHSGLFRFLLKVIFVANGNYYFIKDRTYNMQPFLSWLSEVLEFLKSESKLVDKLKSLMERGNIFKAATSAELCRITMEYLLRLHSLPCSLDKTVFLGKECLWPVSTPSLESLERIFFSLLPYEIETPFFSGSPRKSVYFSIKLTQFHPQTLHQLEQLDTLAFEIPLKKCLLPLAVLHDLLQNENSLPDELKIAMTHYFEEVILLFRNSFTFKDHQIQYPYAKNGKTFSIANQAQRPLSCDHLSLFLIQLAKHPLHFKKLLNLSLEEYRHDFNQDHILRKVAESQIFVLPENLLCNKLIHEVSLIFENHPTLLIPLLSEIDNWEQAFFMTALILSVKEISTFFEDAYTLSYFTFIIQSYLKKIPPDELIKDIAKIIQMNQEGNAEVHLSQGLGKPILEYIRKIQNSRNEIRSSPPLIDPSYETLFGTDAFTVTQLLTAIDRNELCFDIPLKRLLFYLGKQPKKVTQTLLQCIERGSPREGFDITFIECLQNSIDAAVAFKPETYKASVDLRRDLQEDWEEFLATISFNIELIESTDKLPQIAFEIRDGTGIKNLVSLFVNLLVTNFSEKSSKERATGKRGNGIFQIFKEASHFTLKTRLLEDPSQVLFLRILPIRDKNGEVFDLSVKVFDLSSDEAHNSFIGTEIRVLFQNSKKSKEELLIEIARQRKFLRETVSNTLSHLNDGRRIRLLLKSGEYSTETLSVWGEEKIFFKSDSFVFQLTNQSQMPGFVLTNGLPFKPLAQFLSEKGLLSRELADRFCFGWCLNLDLDSYTPVQSRQNIRLKKGKQEELQELVAEWLFVRCLLDEPLGPNKRYFPHLDSPGHFSQIYPGSPKKPSYEEILSYLQKGGVEVLPDFYTYYHSKRLDNGRFIDAIDIGYMEVVSKLIATKCNFEDKLSLYDLDPLEEKYNEIVAEYRLACQEIFTTWKKRSEKFKEKPLKKEFLERIVFPWFENKVSFFSINIKSLAEIKNSRPDLKTEAEKNNENTQRQIVQEKLNEILMGFIPVHKIPEFAEEILLSYCQIHCSINQTEPPSIGFIYNPHSTHIAFYTKTLNRISVNLAYFPISEILSHAFALCSRQMISDNPDSMHLITVSLGKAGHLNHELEHLRRNTGCLLEDYDVHSAAVDEEGRKVSFEACAASFARRSFEMGLWDSWAERISDFMEKNAISIEMLDIWIQKLRILEKSEMRTQLNAILQDKPEATKKKRRIR